MSQTKYTLFSQVLALIDRNIFNKVVRKYDTDKHQKDFNSWTHLVSMLFMHLADANSLRDISNGLRSATGNLNHLGIAQAPSKSGLSYRNATRNYELFRELYYDLFDKLSNGSHRVRLYAKRLKRQIFIMDSSIIPLSLSLFDWAKFRTRKGAIKLHAVLDYDSGLPCYAVITEGKRHDVSAARELSFPSGSVLVADRAYVDFDWLYNLDSTDVFFVTRLKKNTNIEVVKQHMTNGKHDHILDDQQIKLTGFYTRKTYPKRLRVVRVFDAINQQELILLTNNLFWTANTISQLYKARWDIEVFFKHIKQIFGIKSFVGTSANAVRIQMWTAMIAMLLLRYLKNKAIYKWNLSNLITFMRINLFVKINLWKWLHKPILEKANSPPQNTIFENL